MNNSRSSRLRINHQAPVSRESDTLEFARNPQSEIEDAICQAIRRFEKEYMGREPRDIQAHLIGDLLVVRLQGVLPAAELQLVKALPADKGRTLLKQVRGNLVEVARPIVDVLVREVIGVPVVSFHHDVSTVTGEEVVLFTLAGAPLDVNGQRS